MFTGDNSARFFPWNLAAILACAELSYWLVERPSLRLRDRLELAWDRKQKTARLLPPAIEEPTHA
jgi:peptidoglycan/LPS O-acetylase OafA/YrhL